MKTKSLRSIAVSALAATALAETILDSEEIGVVKHTGTAGTEVAIGVPWQACGSAGEASEVPVKVSDLIASGLSDGDILSVWNGSAYYSWKWEDGAWTEAEGPSGTPAATAATVTRGQAVWYTPAESKTYTLMGCPVDTASTSPTTANGYTLLANPLPTDVTVSGIGGDDGDEILLINSVSSTTSYVCNDGSWCTTGWTTTIVGGKTMKTRTYAPVANTVKIPAGTGFWYISNGGSPTITWPAE